MNKTHYERLIESQIPIRKSFAILEQELPNNLFTWESFCKTEFISAQESLLQSEKYDPQDILTTNQILFHGYAYYKGSGRVYEVSENIAEMLLDTKLDVDTSLVKSPFREIIIEVPPDFLKIYNTKTGMHDLENIYVNFDEEVERVLRVLCVGKPKNGAHVLDDAVFYFRIFLHEDKIYDCLKKSIEDWKQNPNYSQYTTINDEEILPRIFQFVLNVLLYITSQDCDIRKQNTEYAELKKKIDGLKNPSKIRKLQQKLGRTSQIPRYIIGGSINLSPDEKKLYDGIRTSKKHSIRYPVGGHWRMQPYGEKLMKRKHIWIKPHFRGPELAELIKSVGILK